MADISLTAAEVTPAAGTPIFEAIAGVAITAGQIGYLDPADTNKAKLGDANGAGLAHSPNIMFMNNAAAGQPVSYVKAGATVVIATSADKGAVGEPLIASANAGAICPTADYASGWYHTLVMYLDATKRAGTLVFATAPAAKP